MDDHLERAQATVDLAAVRHNVGVLGTLAGDAALCAVVKADGYGHGAIEVAGAALAAGARWLAVAHAAEGAALRAAGYDAPILLLSEPLPGEIPTVVRAELRVAVYSAATVERLVATGARIPVHLKLDTGMNRVGADAAAALALARVVDRSPMLELEGVWTHCAVADEPEDPFTARQLERFSGFLDRLHVDGIEPAVRHAANSAAMIAHPASRFDLVRPGIALYGIAPAAALAGRADLRAALRLTSVVSFVKRVPAGETVSYGRHHRVVTDTTIATVPIGYADGVPRAWGRRGGRVLLAGTARPVVGVVTMDQLMVDCGPEADVAVGDEVVLIGRTNSSNGASEAAPASIDVHDLAEATDTIAYEIVTGLGRRVTRRYVDGAAPAR